LSKNNQNYMITVHQLHGRTDRQAEERTDWQFTIA